MQPELVLWVVIKYDKSECSNPHCCAPITDQVHDYIAHNPSSKYCKGLASIFHLKRKRTKAQRHVTDLVLPRQQMTNILLFQTVMKKNTKKNGWMDSEEQTFISQNSGA